MYLLNLFNSLKYGVLNNTSFSEIDPTKQDEAMRLVPFIEEGLSQLYGQFALRKRALVLEMQEGVTFYHLTTDYSMQGHTPSKVPRPYILDLPQSPFDGDVVKVLEVVDSNDQYRPIGDLNSELGVFLPQYNILHVPSPVEGEYLNITYQARPLTVVFTYGIADRQAFTLVEEVMLPEVLVPALTHYVAYMVYSRIGTQESLVVAQSHLAMYVQICQGVSDADLANNSASSTNVRFTSAGWV